MKKTHLVAIVLVLLVGAGLALPLLRTPAGDASSAGDQGDDEYAQEEGSKGPHGGRLLTQDDFAVEVTIFERGVPPEFRVYGFAKERAVPPAAVDLSIELHRLGGQVDSFRFAPVDDYQRGDREVAEPHSFDVSVTARYEGKTFRWDYPSYEGRVELGTEAVRAAKIEIEAAGPATVRTTLDLTGQIVVNEDRIAHVIPRFPGVAKEVRKRLGDSVVKGEILAVVQSNESLQSYDIPSQISGTVIKKHATPGEFIGQGEDIYVVADLSSVWVDLNVYRQDFPRLKVGQRVILDAGEGLPKAESTISYISPFGAPNTQTMLARAEIRNPTGAWRPGLFVQGKVIVEEATVPVAVKTSALQTFRDWTIVFVQEGDFFEARPIELGRQDGEWVEVLSGLRAGQRYAAGNSFVLKAELGKAGAAHEH